MSGGPAAGETLATRLRAARGPLAAWVALCLLLALVASRMQPMQSPDEQQHVVRAWLLAHGQWQLHAPGTMMSGGDIDAHFHDYAHGMLRGWAGEPELRTPPSRITELRTLRWRHDDERRFIQIPGTGYYLPLIYLPQAIGLRLGEALGWTIEGSYRLARLLAQMSTAALLVAAWMIARPQRPPMLVLGLLVLPMTLFQFAAPTIDGMTTGLALVMLALVWRPLATGAPLETVALAALGVGLLVLVGARLHALPMLALPLLLAWRTRQRRIALLGLALLAAILAWNAWAGAVTVDTRAVRALSAAEIARHYLLAPWDFIAVLGRTLASEPWRDFMGQSFVGVLGWLDTPLPAGSYRWLGLGLFALVLPSLVGWHAAPRLPRLACAAMALPSTLIVFAALLAAWTPHPAEVILGMQGRYLLLPALLACFALLPCAGAPDPHHPDRPGDAGERAESRSSRRLGWALLGGFAALSLQVLMSTLSVRYGGAS
jgi:hypothetical protein